MNDDAKKTICQMLGTETVPASVEKLYRDVKFAYDRVGGSGLQPQTLALIAVLGNVVAMEASEIKPETGQKADDPTPPRVPAGGRKNKDSE